MNLAAAFMGLSSDGLKFNTTDHGNSNGNDLNNGEMKLVRRTEDAGTANERTYLSVVTKNKDTGAVNYINLAPIV
jgi:hypothetical protein